MTFIFDENSQGQDFFFALKFRWIWVVQRDFLCVRLFAHSRIIQPLLESFNGIKIKITNENILNLSKLCCQFGFEAASPHFAECLQFFGELNLFVDVNDFRTSG
jgi:hypothetical protein